MNRWSNNNPGVFTFNQTADADHSYNPFQNACNASVDYNGLFYQTGGSAFGQTTICAPSATITRFILVMQTRSDWDTGSGGTHDFESVVTHEAGHATGFGSKIYITGNPADQHFLPASQPSGICWDDADFHTMCNGLVPVPAKTKTLELHDIHTFTAAY
jgi:hypothetical protein